MFVFDYFGILQGFFLCTFIDDRILQKLDKQEI